MRFPERKPLRERAPTALLALAIAGFAVALIEAMTTAPVSMDAARPFTWTAADSSPPGRTGPVNAAAIQLAAGRDPFRPDRSRAPMRFGLPHDDVNAQEPMPAAQEAELIGTVALPKGGGLAMLRWGTEPPRLFRIGQTMHGVTLTDVAPGRVTLLTASGATIVLRVARTGS